MEHDPRSPIGRTERVVVPVLAIGAAAVFATVGLGRSLWVDEAFSALLATRDAAGIVESLRNDGSFPAYFLLLRGWVSVAGESEAALRVPSVALYLAGIAMTGVLAATAFGDRRIGAYAGFFFLVSDLAVQHAQNARPYAMVALVVAASHAIYLRALFRDGTGRGWLAALAAVNALGALTHVWFLFVIAAQGVGLLWCGSWRRRIECAAALASSLVPFALLWLDAFIGQIGNRNSSWIRPLHKTIGELPTDFYHPAVTVLIAGVAIWALRTRRRDAEELTRAATCRVLVVLTAVTLAIPLAVSLIHPIYVPNRYAIVALPPLAALLAAIVVRAAGVRSRCALAVAAIAVTATAHVVHREHVFHPDVADGFSDRKTAEFLLRNAPRGDALCFTSVSRVTIDYYLRRHGASERYVERTFPAETDAHPCFRVASHVRSDFPELRAEAARLAAELEERARTRGVNVWLFYGDDLPTSDLMRQELDRRLVRCGDVPMMGSNYAVIILYRARG